ncbi:OOP family OmpA-OmpF porin [Acinetobacter calcoaceticus]|uniref:OOP family OmpA-OmpF porin n=1 Tax=Acinetobacter calcoaceticus TaxID=471 RepID=A0A4R1XSP3_ACICA|nr:OOP family OmpA-OmpF porin [Acinetobacter calcoaceticus]
MNIKYEKLSIKHRLPLRGHAKNTIALLKRMLAILGLGLSLSVGFGLSLSSISWAQPVIAEGVVPNEATKQAVLNQLRGVYGADQVVDKLQVRAVAAPHGWSDAVNRLITPDLKKVSQGKLDINGTSVSLTGKLSNPADIQNTTAIFQSLVQQPYQLNAQFSVNQAEQKVLDDTLKNRVIEFESGSAILTASGIRILDEMVVALNKVQGKNIKIVGHTDNQGDPTSNKALSQQRAEAVKNYLVSKSIEPNRLSLAGLGADQPVADNSTADGRRKNRRIEFDVL